MNLERRKKSEQWVRKKAEEFVKSTSDLTFAEWCYQQGKADERRKFAEILKSKPYFDEVHNMESIPISFIDEVLTEYEKEQK